MKHFGALLVLTLAASFHRSLSASPLPWAEEGEFALQDHEIVFGNPLQVLTEGITSTLRLYELLINEEAQLHDCIPEVLNFHQIAGSDDVATSLMIHLERNIRMLQNLHQNLLRIQHAAFFHALEGAARTNDGPGLCAVPKRRAVQPYRSPVHARSRSPPRAVRPQSRPTPPSAAPPLHLIQPE